MNKHKQTNIASKSYDDTSSCIRVFKIMKQMLSNWTMKFVQEQKKQLEIMPSDTMLGIEKEREREREKRKTKHTHTHTHIHTHTHTRN